MKLVIIYYYTISTGLHKKSMKKKNELFKKKNIILTSILVLSKALHFFPCLYVEILCPPSTGS